MALNEQTEQEVNVKELIHQSSNGSSNNKYSEEFRSPELMDADDIIGHYIRDAAHLPLLSAEEEIALAKAYERGRKARREAARKDLEPEVHEQLLQDIQDGNDAFNYLVRANLRLVISIAKKYQGRGLPLTDLIQAGNIGLMRAAKKFDYSLGNRFSTYATWWIRQAVSRSIANNGRTIRIPAHTSEKLSKLHRIRNRLSQKLDRDPTFEEIAAETGMPPRKVEQIIRYGSRPLSLDMPIGTDGDSAFGDLIQDSDTPGPEEVTTRHLLEESVHSALEEVIPPREARVLRLRYGIDTGKPLTLREVGEKEGVTRERVRQIEARAMRRLRRPQVRRKLQAYLENSRI